MLGIIIAIASALFMAGMQILLKKSYKEVDPSVAFLFDMLFGLIIWIPVGFIFGANFNDIVKCIPYAVISAILSEALVFYALSKGNLSVATVLMATYPIYTLLFSTILNGETLGLVSLLLVALTIIGTILTAIDSDFKLKNMKELTVLIPFLTAVCIGLSDTLTKGVIDKTSSFSFLVAIAMVQLPVAIIYLILAKQNIGKVIKEITQGVKEYQWSIYGSLLNVIGTGLLLISFNYAYASIASPLTATYTPLVLIYSFVVLKEKVSKVNFLGIILALVGAFGIIILGG